jgi:hypothetical protein
VRASDMRGNWSDAVQELTIANRAGSATGCAVTQRSSSAP